MMMMMIIIIIIIIIIFLIYKKKIIQFLKKTFFADTYISTCLSKQYAIMKACIIQVEQNKLKLITLGLQNKKLSILKLLKSHWSVRHKVSRPFSKVLPL